MKESHLNLSIFYSSRHWDRLLIHAWRYFEKYTSDLEIYVFLDKEKGDAIRFLIIIPEIMKDSFRNDCEQVFLNFLHINPSRRSNKGLKEGEYLWMKYPNNSISFLTFRVPGFTIDRPEDTNLPENTFSKFFSLHLLTNAQNNRTLLSYFLSVTMLILKVFPLKNRYADLNALLEEVEEKSEIRQEEGELTEIYRYAGEDLKSNWSHINENLSDALTTESLTELEIKLTENASKLNFQSSINIIILQLGLDFKKQLYALHMLRLYYGMIKF